MIAAPLNSKSVIPGCAVRHALSDKRSALARGMTVFIVEGT
jgi:hypothetical protein